MRRIAAPFALLLLCACELPGGNDTPDAGLVDLPATDFEGLTPLADGTAGVIANAPTNFLGVDGTHAYYTAEDVSGQGGGESIFRVGHAGGTFTRLVTSASVSFGNGGGGFAMNGTWMSWSRGSGLFRAPVGGGPRTSLQRAPSFETGLFYVGDTLFFDGMVASRPGLHRSTDGLVSEHVTSFAGPYAADETYAYMVSGNLQTRVSRFPLDGSSETTEQLALIAEEEMAGIHRIGEWLYVFGPSIKRVKTTDGTVEVVVAKEHGPVAGFAIDGEHVWFTSKPDTNGQTKLQYQWGNGSTPITVVTGQLLGTRFGAANGYAFFYRGGLPTYLERVPAPTVN